MESCLREKKVLETLDELNEPQSCDERQLEINKLRNSYITQDCGIRLFDNSDGFLLKFLRARKFNQNEALKLLTNYHTFFKNWPQLHKKVKNPQLIKHVFEAGCIFPLIGKALDGSVVCISRPGKMINLIMEDYLAALIVSIETLLKDENNQLLGITFIVDNKFITFQFIEQLNPSLLYKFIDLHQNVLPIRTRVIAFVNESKYFYALYLSLCLFMNRSLKNSVTFQGNNFNELRKVVEISVLPPDYEGTGPSTYDVVEKWKSTVLINNPN